MSTKYPIILVHGIMLKDWKFFKAFGNIQKILQTEGHRVYTAPTDGFGSIETNAAQLQICVQKIMAETGAAKVNLICHSKGGLDARYMIDTLHMEDAVASVTFLATPHKGSQIATKLYAFPKPLRWLIALYLTIAYRIFGDKKPEVLKVCQQLSYTPDGVLENFDHHDGIFMQSYSTTLEKSSDDFVMGIPLYFSRRFENIPSDGLVSVASAQFAEYKGNCTDASVSHSEIVDFMVGKQKKEKIYAFYISLCQDLAERGF